MSEETSFDLSSGEFALLSRPVLSPQSRSSLITCSLTRLSIHEASRDVDNDTQESATSAHVLQQRLLRPNIQEGLVLSCTRTLALGTDSIDILLTATLLHTDIEFGRLSMHTCLIIEL